MKKLLLLCFLISVFYSPAIMAQDTPVEEEAPSFTLSGSVDAYFHTSLGSETDAPTTSFSQLPGFSLGMVNLIASYQGAKVGFTGDLVFGPRGYDAVFENRHSGQRIVNQLFAYYKLSDAVTLNLGQFNTFLGYEVISPAVNFNYSTSYMFTNGPFSHTGLRADFDLGGGLGAKLAIMNPTDFVEFNPYNTYTIGAQLGYTNDNGGAWLNFLYGDQDGKLNIDDPSLSDGDASAGSTLQIDLTTGWNISENFYLGFNGTIRTQATGEIFDEADDEIEDIGGDASGFMGVAIYPKITLSESFALGLRGEYFKVNNFYSTSPFNLDGEGDGSVIAVTLSANYTVGNLVIIPEIRLDKTSENSFVNSDFEAADQLITFNLAAVYKF